MSNSIISRLLNPETRIMANAAYTLKQWTKFVVATKNKFKLQSEEELQTAYNNLLHFMQYAGEISPALNDSQIAEYMEVHLNIKSPESLAELFHKDNWESLMNAGYQIPGIYSYNKETGEPIKITTPVGSNASMHIGNQRSYNNTSGKTTKHNIPKTRRYTVSTPKNHQSKYNHVIPDYQRVDARVDPAMYYIAYDANGVAPMMMVKIDAAHMNMSQGEWRKDGYFNALRYKYGQDYDVCNNDVRLVSMKYYQGGRYKNIADIYGKPASSMPGLKKNVA